MSNLVVSNISDGTTTVGTGYVVNGSAKAWVNFNGTGTIAIRDSMNVSSLTDNATGNHSVTYSSSMANVNYQISGAAAGGTIGILYSRQASPTRATTYINFFTLYQSDLSGNGGYADMDSVDQSTHGDLA